MSHTGNTGGWYRKRPARELSPLGFNFWEELLEPLAIFNESDNKRRFSPKIDIRESETEIKVRAELPGLSQDQVSVNVTDEALVIKGEKKEEHEEKDEKNVKRYVERSYGSFQRVIPLNLEVEHDKVDASFKNGILTVVLPKSTKEKNKVKSVNIRSE